MDDNGITTRYRVKRYEIPTEAVAILFIYMGYFLRRGAKDSMIWTEFRRFSRSTGFVR